MFTIYNSNGSGFDFNLIHDNRVYIPTVYAAGGYGVQFSELGGTGISLYNNTCIAYITNASLFSSGEASAHQDCYQTLSGSYNKIYNNVFINAENIGLFLDAYYLPGFSHYRIYNNIIYQSIPVLSNARGISVVNDAGTQSGCVGTDIVIANNVIANFGYANVIPGGYSVPAGTYGAYPGLLFGNLISGPSVAWSGNVVANNLLINCGMDVDSSAATFTDNVEIDGANAGNFCENIRNLRGCISTG